MSTHAGALCVALSLALGLTGCLPSSQRRTDRSVSAADSASTALAETVPTDTLAVGWTVRAPETDPMLGPTTLAWLGDTLAVAETQTGSIRWFAHRADAGRTDLGADAFPYLAGVRGDTLVVLARGTEQLLWVRPGQGVVRTLSVPGATAAFAEPGRLAVRIGGGPMGEGTPEAAILRIDESGRTLGRHAIGQSWRALGFVRAWGDSLVALSGYRPVLDLIPDTGSAPADTLALAGFASPQLARSAQFMRGDVDEPPLLTSSAVALGDRLFAINLRGDHVRIDVYGRDGRLQRALVSPRPWAPIEDVAIDLAIRERDGAIEMAVLQARKAGILSEPDARIVLYRWVEAEHDEGGDRRPVPALAS